MYRPGESGEGRSATCKSFVVLESDKLIILKSNRKIKHVRIENITHVICDSSVCDVFFKDGTKFCCSKPLRYFEELLEPYRFARISHNILVNIDEIAEITSDGKRNHTAMMNNKQTLHISQRKWKNLKESLKNSVALIGENNAVTVEKPSLK